MRRANDRSWLRRLLGLEVPGEKSGDSGRRYGGRRDPGKNRSRRSDCLRIAYSLQPVRIVQDILDVDAGIGDRVVTILSLLPEASFEQLPEARMKILR